MIPTPVQQQAVLHGGQMAQVSQVPPSMQGPMPGPMQGGPMMMPNQPGVAGQMAGPPHPPNQPQQMQPEQPKDNIAKVKSLHWPLKETLANVMKIAAQNVYDNSAIDLGMKTGDQQPPRFDKALEEFYSVCDQIELNLKVALECASLTGSSQKYTPHPVATAKPEMPNTTDANSYGQYISTVKLQVSHAKEMHDALTNVVRSLNNAE